MIETALTLALVALLSAGLLAPWLWVATAGAVGIAVGLLLGVPTGFWYHVELGRALRAHGAPPPRWWLRPVSHHDALEPSELARALPWFYLGGAGFVVTVGGCALLTLAALRTLFGG